MMKGLKIELKSKDWKKVFNLTEDEDILASFHCSLSLKTRGIFENMTQGTLFVTANSLCFYSSLFSVETKEIIHFSDVQSIIKRNAARIIPNSLEIATNTKRFFFSSFLNRPAALRTIKKQWKMKKLNLQSIEISNWSQALGSASIENKEEVELAMKKISSRYEIVKPLGEGSFGKTFIILDKDNFRQYVLKRIDCVSESATIDAVKEMVLLRLLRHPYIVGYKDFWREGKSVYLVMEYCQGGDMAKYILSRFNNHTNTSDLGESNSQENSDNENISGVTSDTEGAPSLSPRGTGQPFQYIPEKQIMRWLIQTCLAIEHMHLHGTLHRDIKPSNLFLNRWNDIKLGDLGLSYVTSQTKAKKLSSVGTLGYAAPEILKAKPYDSKSDIYALGCTLYEMCTLRSVLEDQKSGLFPVTLPRSVYSAGLEKLTKSMVSNNPEKRPSASEILEHPLLKNIIGKVSVESEIYSELQQREDENQQLVLKLKILQNSLSKTLNTNVVSTAEGLADLPHHFGYDDGTGTDVTDSTPDTSLTPTPSSSSNSSTTCLPIKEKDSIKTQSGTEQQEQQGIIDQISTKLKEIIPNAEGLVLDSGLGIFLPTVIILLGACIGFSSRIFFQIVVIILLSCIPIYLSTIYRGKGKKKTSAATTTLDSTSVVTGSILTLLYSSIGLNSFIWRVSSMFSGIGIYSIFYSLFDSGSKKSGIEELSRIGAVIFSITASSSIILTDESLLTSKYSKIVSVLVTGTIIGLIHQLAVWLCIFCLKKNSIFRTQIEKQLKSLKFDANIKQGIELGLIIAIQLIFGFGILIGLWILIGFGRYHHKDKTTSQEEGQFHYSVWYCVWSLWCGILEAVLGVAFVIVGRISMLNPVGDKWMESGSVKGFCGIVGACCITLFVKSVLASVLV